MSNKETKVIKITDLKIENIKISAPRANKKGGKAVYINYDYEDGMGAKPLRIQMPKMKVPFGVSGYEDGIKDGDGTPSEKSTDSLEFSLGERKDVIKKLEAIDKLVLKVAGEKSVEFFNKKNTAEVIEAFFVSSLKYNKDKEGNILNTYPPRIKTKLYKDDKGKYNTDIFTSDKKQVKMDIYNYDTVLPRGSDCVSLLECGGIWIVSGKFGCSWRPKQLIVYKADHSLSGFSFIPDDDLEEEEPEEEEPEEVEKQETEEDPEEEEEIETQEEVVEETEDEPEQEDDEEPEAEEEDPLEQVVEEVKPKAKAKGPAASAPRKKKA